MNSKTEEEDVEADGGSVILGCGKLTVPAFFLPFLPEHEQGEERDSDDDRGIRHVEDWPVMERPEIEINEIYDGAARPEPVDEVSGGSAQLEAKGQLNEPVTVGKAEVVPHESYDDDDSNYDEELSQIREQSERCTAVGYEGDLDEGRQPGCQLHRLTACQIDSDEVLGGLVSQ